MVKKTSFIVIVCLGSKNMFWIEELEVRKWEYFKNTNCPDSKNLIFFSDLLSRTSQKCPVILSNKKNAILHTLFCVSPYFQLRHELCRIIQESERQNENERERVKQRDRKKQEREREKEREGKTERQKDMWERKGERQTDRQRVRQNENEGEN